MTPRGALASFILIALTAIAQAQTASRDIPARSIPVPDTVSPEMQAIIAAPLSNWDVHPKSLQEWRDMVAQGEARNRTLLPKLREQLAVTLAPTTLGGVNAYILTPREIAPENRNRVFLHFHGGGYVRNPGEGGTREATIMAAFGRAKVISVDYRLAPDHPYPAALDDAVGAYRELIKTVPARNVAVFGTSTGGGLTMALVLRAKAEGLPLPGALGLGSPWVDITKTGDTFTTNEFVDNFQVSYDGWLGEAAKIYANGHDPKDPMLSPIYGDLHGFPPAILTSGTRDLLLSLTVRAHRKLRQSGVEAVLQVFEGVSHTQYSVSASAPETREAFEEIARFFDTHLGK